MQPEAMVAEPGVMGWSHRGYGVGDRGYGVRARVNDMS